jgi:DNA-binding transcriptional MerR regulator
LLNLSLANAALLYENDFLSFDPAQKRELNEFEYHELLFCGSLFCSGLSLASIKNLLSHLDKPYAYNISNSFFDFCKKEWMPHPELPDIDDLIGDLMSDDATERLIEIKERIEEYLKEQNKQAK